MPPKDFIQARESGVEHAIVDGKPYLPKIIVAPKGPAQDVAAAVVAVLNLSFPDSHGNHDKTNKKMNGYNGFTEDLKVERVLGGLSNTLYRVSGLRKLLLLPDRHHNHQHHENGSNGIVTTNTTTMMTNGNGNNNGNSNCLPFDSILVRIFGAEGMIDRDVETSTFAALATAGHTPPYHGRFGNGRLEGWMDGMRPLQVPELSRDNIITAVAHKVAVLHTQFIIPDDLQEYYRTPSMWQQLEEWLQQALQNTYQNDNDRQRAAMLELETIQDEFDWMRREMIPPDALVVYCHNDVLAANILLDDTTQSLQLIDFEYGGCNYRSFDVANHWNEYAGGPPNETVPRYDWLPDQRQQTLFCRAYLEAINNDDGGANATDEQVQVLLREVQAFLLPNHLYWGLWAVNQAATEGCQDYDYMRYGMERFRQYHICKEQLSAAR